jgi:spore maturation protein CgeB
VGGWADNGFGEKKKIMVDIFSHFMKSGLKCGFFINKNISHQQECDILANSKLTLNIHDAYQRILGLDTNERTFKSLGLNGLLVSDSVGQLNNMFPNVSTSLDAAELVQITKDILDLSDTELSIMREDNRHNILTNHCYTHRVQTLLNLE